MVSVNDKTLGGYIRKNEKLLLTLEETVNPKHTALIVVDRQYDFVYGKGKTGPTPGKPNPSEKITLNIAKFVEVCRKVRVPIFWIVTHHGRDIDLPVYKARMVREGQSPVCMEGTKGAELVSELVPEKGEKTVIKHGYDGFSGTELDMYLKNRRIVTLIMSGGGTGGCVGSTLRHAFHLGYYIVIGSDITKGRDEKVHLEHFRKNYGLVVTSKEIANIWGIELK